MVKHIFSKLRQHRDLTQGSITRNIWLLSIPMIASNLLQSTFDLVNIFWVGHLGSIEVAAVAMSSSIIMVVMFLMMGIGVGTTALVARAIGRKNQPQANLVAMQSIILGFFGSIILALLGYFISAPLLALLRAEPAVLALGTQYLHITFIGIFVMFYMFMISAILQGAGDAVTPMIVLAVAIGINLVLDPLLIFGIGFPRLGVPGAAVASVIARSIGSLIALEVLLRGRSRVHLKIRNLHMDWDLIWRIFKIGFPSSIQLTLRGLMGIALIAIVASFGTFAVAAYGIGLRINMLVMMPGFAFGMAAATMVGQNLGAKLPERAVSSAWAAVKYYGLFMVFMALVFIFFAPQLIGVFDPNPSVISIGARFLRIIALANPFTALGLILDRSLAGAGDTVITMTNTFIALWLIQIPLAYYLSHMTGLGIDGIWTAMLAAPIVLAILNTTWFQIGHWKHKKV